MDEFLKWLPQNIRNQELEKLKGYVAVKFPAAYFVRVPKSASMKWVTLTSRDSDGFIVKTGPQELIEGLIETMKKYNQDCWKVIL